MLKSSSSRALHSGASKSPLEISAPDNNMRSNANGDSQTPRRSSFNFLRRQKSTEVRPSANRNTSGGKMTKKQRHQYQDHHRQQFGPVALPKLPLCLPSHSPLPSITSLGVEHSRNDSIDMFTGKVGEYVTVGSDRPSVEYKTFSSPRGIVSHHLPVSSTGKNGSQCDPLARTESMTHRGRCSYASIAVSTMTTNPRRVRRRKDPMPFNVLVVGAKNSGKTSFINFLCNSFCSARKKVRCHSPSPVTKNTRGPSPVFSFTSHYLETEVDSERIGLTIWDSQGLEKSIVDLQLREMSAFLESKFEETFTEEQKVVRAPGVRDTHIHCVFLILDPGRLDMTISESRKVNCDDLTKPGKQFVAGLDEDLDLQVLHTLQGKTTVIPVISKADTITSVHMSHLKNTVWNSLKQAKLDPLEALNLSESDSDDDEDEEDELILSEIVENGNHACEDSESRTTNSHSPHATRQASRTYNSEQAVKLTGSGGDRESGHNRHASSMSPSTRAANDEIPYLPLSIISPDVYEPGIIGRRFPWGFADPFNVEHCDFVRLKESVFSEWRSELHDASRDRWYEGWRTSRLERRIPTATQLVSSDRLG